MFKEKKDMFEKCVTYVAHMQNICQRWCDISMAYVFAYVQHVYDIHATSCNIYGNRCWSQWLSVYLGVCVF